MDGRRAADQSAVSLGLEGGGWGRPKDDWTGLDCTALESQTGNGSTSGGCRGMGVR